MDTREYRREYAAFCAAFERERYRHESGLMAEPGYGRVFERFADLWTRQAIDDLRRAFDETPADFETERAGLHALLGAAREGYLRSQTRELSEELARCEEWSQVVWEKERVAASEVPERLAAEKESARRRELAARWLDAVSTCDDLRAELLDSRRASTRALGFDDERALYEETTGAKLEVLARGADAFLERTSNSYYSRLAGWVAREPAPMFAGELQYADASYFRRMSSLDSLFPPGELRTAYTETFKGLGIRVEAQENIRIDDEPRPLKKARTDSFRVGVPSEIYLLIGARAQGARLYRDFFQAAGEAQADAWASRELAARHPEFIYAPDGATREGFGLLFRSLFCDVTWLGERRGLRASETEEIAEAFMLVEMHDVRLCSARLRYGLALFDADDVRSEQLSEIYATLHTEATGFRYHPATSLLDAAAAQRAAESLRARLFAVGFVEYLRARHGRRWWASRRAGDELRDIWNTASRYRVEELARLVGAGEPDFELLAGSFKSA